MWQLFYSKEGIIILIITEGTIAQLKWKMETEGCCSIIGCWGLWAEIRLDESVGTATGW